ncbi:hypothetical protein ASPCAL07787 [Aspergillus calidoustus]|uniref:Uncharacterized protein n=1 Tax=Aspergillus calidoustus TaxID=454130 RepID=A0A0U5GVA5_ASPCI|nr:hypothetical protein ASPCAL07787 [Aspergillus calidoustus]
MGLPPIKQSVRELRPHAKIEASAADIETYVGSEIHKRYFVLSNELADDPVLRSHVINAIVSRSRGMFLHAEFYVKFLATKHNLRDLQDGLEGLPMTSSAISAGDAADASQSPETVTLAQKMLSWIVSAVEPMKIQHLQIALALREVYSRADTQLLAPHLKRSA